MKGKASFTKKDKNELEIGFDMMKRMYPLTSVSPLTTAPKDPKTPWIETISWSPRIFVYHNFLSEAECDEIIELAGSDVERSRVVSSDGNGAESKSRTSFGVFLTEPYMTKSPLLRIVEERIANWTQLPSENGEAYYLLRYEIGQEYKPHTDWFQNDAVGKKHIAGYGNRIATVLTYLHSPEEGGETTFPKINLKVPAKRGDSVLFWDLLLDGNGDAMALHGSSPVIKGIKWAMTKWIRERKYWRYDDAYTPERKAELKKEEEDYLKSVFAKKLSSSSSSSSSE
eukprot:TRINITY_DN2822_c0_g1_i3.p1 TRINITY_DN2822_c0_g1~~TRINITY_DN2822_c0_g1_i3.p1  ORF type:complete len:284 (-),score=62.54 TRINITY_DN2822_c0_g1_i3:64-915(-)